ncbi:SMI1/KNR4 family protein [Jannaschia sp. LMIT008]|uniref:SMI1/KNR4 family protein n=1 Tax=Jannaschia maritima TaxID=3032585 RepID=UPI002811C629|nr:SMI1/KNR4 family protein [Jannaschia sp. LMIT008]
MNIPPETLEWWASMDVPPATEKEVARVERAIGQPLPADYVRFLRQHGFVEWDIDTPDSFDYSVREEGQVVTHTDGSISHLWDADHIERMAADVRAPGGTPPLLYPNTHFPIGGTPDQDQILMELTPKAGRIWYWPERVDEWGSGDNTALGFVADDFTTFVENLRLGD